jgi:DNA-binding transcriptional regulator GbsR (MarR family)
MSEPARKMPETTENEDNESRGEIAGPSQLSVGASQFVEDAGMLLERYGAARIGGRIMGLFMLDEEPLSLDDIAQLLGVSRASVSTNLRMSEALGLAKRVSRPGDRRVYYVGTEDMWLVALKSTRQNSAVQMAEAARTALPKLGPDETVARRHLLEMIDFAEFYTSYLDQMLTEWETYKARRVAERNSQNSGNDA